MARAAALVLLSIASVSAFADSSPPAAPNRGAGLPQQCKERLDRARVESLPIMPAFANGKVEVGGLEDVWPVVEEVTFSWNRGKAAFGVMVSFQGPPYGRLPYGFDCAATWRALDAHAECRGAVGRLAHLRETLALTGPRRRALRAIWRRAADECLAVEEGR